MKGMSVMLSFRISAELLDLVEASASKRPVYSRRGVLDRGEWIRTAIRQRLATEAKNAEYAPPKEAVAKKRGA